jgi:hypothetical protein
MTDEHEKLTAEYERLLKALDGATSGHDLVAAVRHLFIRLGPPTADEAADIDADEPA